MQKTEMTFLSAPTKEEICGKMQAFKRMINQEVKFSIPQFANGEWVSWFDLEVNTIEMLYGTSQDNAQEKAQSKPKKKGKN